MAQLKYWDGSQWQIVATGEQGPQGATGATGPAGADGANFVFLGAWNSGSISYQKYDVVTDSGSSYAAKVNHTSGASSRPGVGGSWTTYWQLQGQKGDTGATGATGDTGPAGTALIKTAANRTTATTGTTALAVNTGETFAITFPASRFSVSPAVTAATNSPRYVAAVSGVTTSGFTLSVRNVSDASGTTYLYHWIAVEIVAGMGN